MARKRLQGGGVEPRRRLPEPSPPVAAHDDSDQVDNNDNVKPSGYTYNAWKLFCEGSILYLAACLLPTLLGYLGYLYHYYYEYAPGVVADTESLPGSWSEYSWEMVDYTRTEAKSYVCPTDSTTSEDSWATYLGLTTWLCLEEETGGHAFLWSPDAQWTDLGTVAFLSATLAVVRVLILVAVAPITDSAQLSAVIRVKSVHMLSRDYQLTPNGTPIVTRKTLAPTLSKSALTALLLPDIALPDTGYDDGYGEDGEDIGLELDGSLRNLGAEVNLPVRNDPWSSPPPPPPHVDVPDALEYLNDLDDPRRMEVNDRVAASSSKPRLATAVFRLVYSGVISAVAFYYFASAEFWPVYVGGSGHTKKCWDLSGALSVGGVDGDFDEQNTTLRRYYLQQASYHWHSGAFHLLSLLLVLTRPGERRLGWFRASSSSYQRSFLQHAIAVLLISTTYVFSSLRRLGAIGMFSFDVSSFFLHLLQVCMNSEKASLLRKALWITFVYQVLVLPTFLYCRFIVWPIVWWSALTESHKWLEQIDRMLFPGASFWLQTLWNTCMAGSMLLNCIHLRRLVNHPHLRQISSSCGQD